MSEFRKLVEAMMSEESPPGFKGTVKAMKKDGEVDNPYALAWWMKNRGYQSHKKADGTDKKESFAMEVEHPTLGPGTVVAMTEGQAEVRWDRLGSWAQHSEHISLEEAGRIVVSNPGKYLHDLSEENDMSKIDLTGEDLQALYEESYMQVPNPKDTILTKQSDFSSDAESTPLSGLDGDGGANNEPHEEGSAPSDAPDTPAVASMDDPSRKAKIAKGGGGSGSNQHKKKAASHDDGEADHEDDDMNKNESFTFEEAGFDLDEMDHLDHGSMHEMGDDYMGEHDMAAGEIAVTKEFLSKLMAAAVKAELDGSKLDMVVDCVAECCSEDRTLDVADISMVMGKLKDKMGGGDADEDVGPGDGEEAGPEVPDMEGETKLMAGDDHDMEEGSQEDRERGRMKRKHKMADKRRDRDGGGRDRAAYRKPKADKRDDMEEGELPPELEKHKIKKGSDADGDGKTNEEVTEGREQLDEAWLMAVPNMGNPKEEIDTEGMSDEDIEIAEIKRLARI